MTVIAQNKTEILQLVCEGIQNPVVASALHSHSQDYISVVIALLNSVGMSKDTDPTTNVGSSFMTVIETVIKCLKIQVENIDKILSTEQQASSLVENTSAKEKLSDYDDIQPHYRSNLNLFECIDFPELRPEVIELKTMINGDTQFTKED